MLRCMLSKQSKDRKSMRGWAELIVRSTGARTGLLGVARCVLLDILLISSKALDLFPDVVLDLIPVHAFFVFFLCSSTLLTPVCVIVTFLTQILF